MYRHVVRKPYQCTIMIFKVIPEGTITFLGSGFFCHSSGYILTCAHHINLQDDIRVGFARKIDSFNHQTLDYHQVVKAKIVQYSPIDDLALLKLEVGITTDFNNDIMDLYVESDVGTTVLYFGYPFGQNDLHTVNVSQGLISSKIINNSGRKQYQLDAMVHEGTSGGPLVEAVTGRVIGIVCGRFSVSSIQNNMISYAIPISNALELFKKERIYV